MESSARLSSFVSVGVLLQHPITERHRRKSPLAGSSILETKTAPRHVASESFKGQISVSRTSRRGYVAAASLIYSDPVSCSLNVSSCIESKISGYWVGPDIDDGCGFIEAYITFTRNFDG